MNDPKCICGSDDYKLRMTPNPDCEVHVKPHETNDCDESCPCGGGNDCPH